MSKTVLVTGGTRGIGHAVITSYSIHYTKLYEDSRHRRSGPPGAHPRRGSRLFRWRIASHQCADRPDAARPVRRGSAERPARHIVRTQRLLRRDQLPYSYNFV